MSLLDQFRIICLFIGDAVFAEFPIYRLSFLFVHLVCSILFFYFPVAAFIGAYTFGWLYNDGIEYGYGSPGQENAIDFLLIIRVIFLGTFWDGSTMMALSMAMAVLVRKTPLISC